MVLESLKRSLSGYFSTQMAGKFKSWIIPSPWKDKEEREIVPHSPLGEIFLVKGTSLFVLGFAFL